MTRQKRGQLTFFVPAALDLAAIFDESDRDYAALFLDMLYRQHLRWRADRGEFVRLKRRYLTRFIPERRWTGIRTKLEIHGVIHIDRGYVRGERSMGFRLDPTYWPSTRIECQNRKLARKIHQWRQEHEQRLLPVHHWLRSKLDRLQFDQALAARIISTMRPDKTHSISVPSYHILLLEMCKRFRYGNSLFFEMDAYGRVHTPITNLPAALRPCLSVDGQRLVGLDLTSSQPLICGLMARRFVESPDVRRRMRNRKFDIRVTPYVQQEIAAIRQRHAANRCQPESIHERAMGFPETPRTCGDSSEQAGSVAVHPIRQLLSGSTPPDLDCYLKLCEEGQLYEHLMESGEDRDQLKVRLFKYVFFGKLTYRSPLKKRFEREFPTIAWMPPRTEPIYELWRESAFA